MSRPDNKTNDNFVFINGDRKGKLNDQDQKLVRSHSKPSKYQRRPAKRASTKWVLYDKSYSHGSKLLARAHPMHSGTQESTSPPATGSYFQEWQQVTMSKAMDPSHMACGHASRPPRHLRLLPFSEDLDSHSLGILHSIYPGIQRAFSVRNFGITTKLHSSQWQDWLLSDRAYLHALLAASSAIQDACLKREPSKQTHLHLAEAAGQLRMRIMASGYTINDVTTAGIALLCVASFVSFDPVAMAVHGTALREIIRLHGGLDQLTSDPQFMFIITRVDLCLSLISGQAPIVQYRSPKALTLATQENSTLCPSDSLILKTESTRYIASVADARVSSIFEHLQSFVRAINLSHYGAQGVTESNIHTSVTTAQYQLLQLENRLDDLLSECLRVAMLAFLTTTFRLLGIQITYSHAAKRLRELCLAIESSTPEMQQLVFWILMVGSIAFHTHENSWLREKWQTDVYPVTKGLGWTEAEQILKQYLWIDHINAGDGQRLFDCLNGGRIESPGKISVLFQ